MKIFLLLLFFMLVAPNQASTHTYTTSSLNYMPTNASVYVNNQILNFDQEPVLLNGRMMVPLRLISESLGGIIEWDNQRIKLIKDRTEYLLHVNSTTVLFDRKIFFLEQPVVVINGRTMVPLRFIAEVLGAKVEWDNHNRIVNIYLDTEYSSIPRRDEDNCDSNYIIYDILAGPSTGPSYNEAIEYVIANKILKTIDSIEYTPIRFTEFGDVYAMVTGLNIDDQEVYIWLVKNNYTEEINVVDIAIMSDGVSRDLIHDKLKKMGLGLDDIKKIYIAPYDKGHIYWYVIAEHDTKQYNYCFSYETGELVIESVIRL